MHTPDAFKVSDEKEIFSFIKTNAFGQLISFVEGRPCVSHLPFLLSQDKKSLICHLAKANPQWENIEAQEVLITFQGAHGYVSPAWYKTKGVPTWNYQAVHIYGKAEIITEAEKLAQIVEELTNKYESNRKKPWKPEYREAMLNAIIGLKIDITEIQAQYKLSQNRSKEDQQQVINENQKIGETALAKAMKKSNE